MASTHKYSFKDLYTFKNYATKVINDIVFLVVADRYLLLLLLIVVVIVGHCFIVRPF